MTEIEWLLQAREHADDLAYLIEHYHPVNRVRMDRRFPGTIFGDPVRIPPPERLPITAASTERACETIREDIRKNFEGDPVAEFRRALDAGDVGRVNTLLNDAWFGVPESTSCWQIRGFRAAVTLLEDLPEAEGDTVQ
jgi:hypothetical protein